MVVFRLLSPCLVDRMQQQLADELFGGAMDDIEISDEEKDKEQQAAEKRARSEDFDASDSDMGDFIVDAQGPIPSLFPVLSRRLPTPE